MPTDQSKTSIKKRALMERQSRNGAEALAGEKFEEAEKCYSKALELARELKDGPAQAHYLDRLGTAKQSLKQFEEARAYLESAAAVAALHGVVRVETLAYLSLGELEQDSGRFDEAIQAFHGALNAAFHCGDDASLELELSFGNLGRLYLYNGWIEHAADCLNEALKVRPDSKYRLVWLGSLGLAMAELGQLDSAIRYYRESFAEAVRLNDADAQAVCKGSEGNALFELNDFSGALECYEEALRLSRKAKSKERIATWTGNIGNTYLRMGNVKKAIELCSEAVGIAKSIDNVHKQAAHLDSLGDCYMAQGDVESAIEKYGEALELSKTISDRQGERIYLSNLGRAYERTGQLQPAFELFVKAIDLFDEQRSFIKADDLKTSFSNRGQQLFCDMIKLCLSMGKRVEALEFVGRSKSRALLDLLSNSPIDITQLAGTEDGELQRLLKRESELHHQISQMERMFWQGPGTGESGHRGSALTPDASKKLYSERKELINELRRYHPNYASLVTASTLGYSEIVGLWSRAKKSGVGTVLDPNTAIVEFYSTDQYLMAAGVWQGAAEPAIHTILDSDKIANIGTDLLSFLEMSATEGWDVPVSLCKRLYEALMEPVVAQFPENIHRLIIVPHASLYRLPFAALHDGNGYLCEKFAISYLPATSLIPLIADGEKVVNPTEAGYLITAISDYSATRSNGLAIGARLRSAAGLDDLSHTLEEAQNIFQLGTRRSSSTKLLTNAEVKDELPTLFSKYPVVHFAGHAVFNVDEPLASGLVLSDGSMLTAASILERSALHTECGKLLVLSACQTGVNSVTAGGEILGLARALMYAGMPNLVLSLWEVADRSTADLMQEFHHKVDEMSESGTNLRVSDALQAAQAKAASAGLPIHAWAPFIHMGID